MKLNNRGITLTEIIISIALISIVLIFLFSLLVTVNDINKESEVNSTYLINKSLILKNIEEDLSKANSVSISDCDVKNSIYSQYGIDKTNVKYYSYREDEDEEVSSLKANFCLKFDYGEGDNAYLGIYYYKNRNSYVISYIHGNVKATRLLPDFEKYNVNEFGEFKHAIEIKPTTYTLGSSINGFFTINIPIIGSDEKDYSIIISYYGK